MTVNAGVDICNQAMARVGQTTIAAFDENSPLASYCAATYPQKRAFLLGLYRWAFATKVIGLSAIDVTQLADEQRIMSAAFVRPSDIIGVVHAYRDQAEIDGARTVNVMESEGRLWANTSPLFAEYTCDISEDKWRPWFRELVITAFAADVANYLQNNSLARELRALAFGTASDNGEGGLMALAKTADAREAPQRTLGGYDDGALINARLSGEPCFGVGKSITWID